ncbi:hypothetical protein ACQHIV_38105 [Kribbella sp. GL6]|uniref:hypothetical protein n=1 Tax=Kribbella sp. GL6 TaxID=3419765 RepID=UPI003D016E84
MYVHSAWLRTSASVDQLNAFSSRLGDEVGKPDLTHGRGLWARGFADKQESGWESSSRTGTWRVGIAVLPGVDSSPDRLVGIVATGPALLAGLVSDLERSFDIEGISSERVQFPLRPLLGGAARDVGVVPRSIRLRSERLRTLIQSDDEAALREQAAAVEGDVVGVTVEAGHQRVTVLDDGSVVFAESASLDDVLVAMRSIQLAVQVAAPVWLE